jgi:hypothetical protein
MDQGLWTAGALGQCRGGPRAVEGVCLRVGGAAGAGGSSTGCACGLEDAPERWGPRLRSGPRATGATLPAHQERREAAAAAAARRAAAAGAGLGPGSERQQAGGPGGAAAQEPEDPRIRVLDAEELLDLFEKRCARLLALSCSCGCGKQRALVWTVAWLDWAARERTTRLSEGSGARHTPCALTAWQAAPGLTPCAAAAALRRAEAAVAAAGADDPRVAEGPERRLQVRGGKRAVSARKSPEQ